MLWNTKLVFFVCFFLALAVRKDLRGTEKPFPAPEITPCTRVTLGWWRACCKSILRPRAEPRDLPWAGDPKMASAQCKPPACSVSGAYRDRQADLVPQSAAVMSRRLPVCEHALSPGSAGWAWLSGVRGSHQVREVRPSPGRVKAAFTTAWPPGLSDPPRFGFGLENSQLVKGGFSCFRKVLFHLVWFWSW